MAIIRVWPVGANPVPKEDGIATFSPGGEDVENTPYVLRRIDFGELTQNDPMLSPPYVAPIPVDAVRTGVVSAALSLLAGPYSNATIQTIGQATAGDGNGKTFYWDATATDAEVVGSVYGVGAVGRWKQAGTITGGGSGGANPTTLSLTISASGTITDPGLAQAGVVLITATTSGLSIRGIRRTTGGVSGKTWSNIGTNAVTIEHDDAGAATTADRVLCPGNVDYVFAAGTSLTTQDDTVAARTRVASLRASSAASADVASVATLASYAQGITSDALAAIVGAAGQTVRTTGKAESGDGADGLWEWRAGSSATANGSLVVGASGSGRWHRIWGGVTFDARWAGVVADGREVTDCTVTAASDVIASASAAFTVAHVGRRVLLDTPSSPITGTVSINTTDYTVYGVGTNFVSEVLDLPYTSVGRGRILEIGTQRVVLYTGTATAGALTFLPSASASGATAYRETQLEATIVEVLSATQARISAAPVVSGTNRKLRWGTDNQAALQSAISTAVASGARVLQLPAGIIGAYFNLGTFNGVTRFRIQGHGTPTSIVTFRRASYEQAAALPDKAFLRFTSGREIVLSGFGLDNAVPVFGMNRSDGGVINNQGGRLGFCFTDCADSGYEHMHCPGFGARDEYLYAEGACPNFFYRDNDLANANNVGINLNTASASPNVIISRNRVRADYTPLLMGSGNAILSSNMWSRIKAHRVGSSPFVVDAGSRIRVHGDTISDIDCASAGVSVVDIFGTPNANGYVDIDGMTIDNVLGSFVVDSYVGSCGLIGVQSSAEGVVRISGVTATRVSAFSGNGRFVHVNTPRAKSVYIGPSTFWGEAGSNMTRGVQISWRTPAEKVTISPEIVYGPSVTNPVYVQCLGETFTNDATRRVTANGAGIQGNAAGFTVHFLARIGTASDENVFAECGWALGSIGWGLYSNASSLAFYGSTGVASVSWSPAWVGTIRMISCRFNGTLLSLWVDGVKVAEAAGTYVAPSGKPMSVNQWNDLGGDRYNDEHPLIALSGGTYVMSDAAILAHYQACKARQSLLVATGDQHMWRLSGQVDQVPDMISGAGSDQLTLGTGSGVAANLYELVIA